MKVESYKRKLRKLIAERRPAGYYGRGYRAGLRRAAREFRKVPI